MKINEIKNDVKIAMYKYHPLLKDEMIHNRLMKKGTYNYNLKSWDSVGFKRFGDLLFTFRPKLKLGVEGNCFIMNGMSDNKKNSFLSGRAKKDNMNFPYVVYVDIDFKGKDSKALVRFKEDFGKPDDLLLKLMDDKNIWISGHSGGGKGIRIMALVYNNLSDEHLKTKGDVSNDEKYRGIYNSNYSHFLNYLEEEYNLKFYGVLDEDYIDRAPISNMVLKTHECLNDGYNTIKVDCNVMYHDTPIVDVVYVESSQTESKPYTKHQVGEELNDISFIPDSEFTHYSHYIEANAADSNVEGRQLFYDKYKQNYSDSGGFSDKLTSFSVFNEHLDNLPYNFVVPLRVKFLKEYLDCTITTDVVDAIEVGVEVVDESDKIDVGVYKDELKKLQTENKKRIVDNKEGLSKYKQDILNVSDDEVLLIKKEELDRKYNNEKLIVEYKEKREKIKNTILSSNIHNDKIEEKLQEDRDEKKEKWIKIISVDYIQVGDNYFEQGPDMDGNVVWEKREINTIRNRFKMKGFDPLFYISNYFNFCCLVDNVNYKDTIRLNGKLLKNTYNKISHVPSQGKWDNINIMLNHIFGDKIEFILDYFKLLYEKPTQNLPIIALVSKDGDTGKSTFLDFLSDLFGDNEVRVSSQLLGSQFNSSFATKLIATIDEAYIDKKETQEKIKSLVTAPKIMVSEKYMKEYPIDFFTKFFIASNNEDFTSASETETRYAIFSPTKPKFKIVDISKKMIEEIPSFLYYLLNRKMFYPEITRLYFDENIYDSPVLQKLKKDTRNKTFLDLISNFEDFFSEHNLTQLQFNVKDIKDLWYKNSKPDIGYIKRMMRDHFELKASGGVTTYTPPNFYGVQHKITNGIYEKVRVSYGGIYTLTIQDLKNII